MSKHTPGPWEFVPKLTASENHRGFFVRAEKATRNGKWALAEVQPGDEDGMLGKANARLIAAAPDLLEALKAFNQCLCLNLSYKQWNEVNEMACAAIAKAEGKE